MKVYRHADSMSNVSRQRQWSVSAHDASHRYHNLREHPELISEVLEDFKPHAEQPAIQEFYELLADINGRESQYETNDCAFNPPSPNASPNVSSRALQSSGRVMFYFRDVPLNIHRRHVEWLEQGVQFYLSHLSPDLDEGAVGTSIMRMHMPELGSERAPSEGFELCLHFFSWGDSEKEAWSNLHLVIYNMRHAIGSLSLDASEKRYLLPENV